LIDTSFGFLFLPSTSANEVDLRMRSAVAKWSLKRRDYLFFVVLEALSIAMS